MNQKQYVSKLNQTTILKTYQYGKSYRLSLAHKDGTYIYMMYPSKEQANTQFKILKEKYDLVRTI